MAVKTKSNNNDIWNNWGIVLADQASTKTGEEADRLYQAACEKYEMAVKSKPDDNTA